MDKKEFSEINDSLKELFTMGRSANVHLLMALQRAETSVVIDGAIRDNFTLNWYEEFISRKFQDKYPE